MIPGVLLAAASVLASVYGDVREHRATGDLLGMELRLHDGAAPYIDFVLCEGWCNRVARLPITPTAQGFDFTYSEIPCGAGAASFVLRYTAERRGRSLVLHERLTGTRYRLKSLVQPFGLQIAASEQAAMKSKTC